MRGFKEKDIGHTMKILTLNTHSLIEECYEEKLISFVEMLKIEQPDVIALQEVNQSLSMPKAQDVCATGYVACPDCDVVVRMDNHAYRVAKLLLDAGLLYQWTWVSSKVGYDVYDEGIAIFSKCAIVNMEQFYISTIQDYNNWKSRKILGICTGNMWFYSVHMGWWDDEEEPFAKQWDVFLQRLKNREQTCFVMGDFNSPADKQNEGYDYVMRSGWMDTWKAAKDKDIGVTVGSVIDGWKDKVHADSMSEQRGMRIDFIFCSKAIPVESSKVVCNDVNYPVVSDHYGVLVEILEL